MKTLKVKNNRLKEESNYFIPILTGTLLGIFTIVIFSVIFAFVMRYTGLETLNIKVISILILILGGLVGAYRSAVKYGRNGMFLGLITGSIILLVIVLIGLVCQTISFEMVDLSLFLIKLFSLMLSGAIGGILGINIGL